MASPARFCDNSAMPGVIEKIGKISNTSVRKCTGKDWATWIKILEKAGARSLSHKDIVAFLRRKYKINAYWQHGVAYAFELHIGRKAEGRNEKGEFMTMASRTFPVGIKAMWKFIESEEGQNVWLRPMSPLEISGGAQFEVEGGIFGEVRTFKKYQRLRLRWQDEEWAKPSIVQIYLSPRAADKCIVIFNHEKLPSDRLRLEMNQRWKDVLTEMLKVVR